MGAIAAEKYTACPWCAEMYGLELVTEWEYRQPTAPKPSVYVVPKRSAWFRFCDWLGL